MSSQNFLIFTVDILIKKHIPWSGFAITILSLFYKKKWKLQSWPDKQKCECMAGSWLYMHN